MKLRDDSFNPSRGWVFFPFVILPVSVVFFYTNYYAISLTVARVNACRGPVLRLRKVEFFK